jgi:hypothetical protein
VIQTRHPEDSVIVQTDLYPLAEAVSESLCRGYVTALTLLGDASEAEVLVIRAISSLKPEHMTKKAIQDAVVQRLVEAQMEIKECGKI